MDEGDRPPSSISRLAGNGIISVSFVLAALALLVAWLVMGIVYYRAGSDSVGAVYAEYQQTQFLRGYWCMVMPITSLLNLIGVASGAWTLYTGGRFRKLAILGLSMGLTLFVFLCVMQVWFGLQ